MAGIFDAGKATSTTRQPATPAKREAVLAWLQAIASSGRTIGGYGGARGKPGIKPDLAALINVIQTNPDALTKITEQSGRPSSPSTFQNLMGGLTTAAMLAKFGVDAFGDTKPDTAAMLQKLILAKALGIDPAKLGVTADALGAGSPGMGNGLGDFDFGGGASGFDFGYDSGGQFGQPGYGVMAPDSGGAATDDQSWLASLFS